MRKIIQVKNGRIGLSSWIEVEPRPQRYDYYVASTIKKLRDDERINKQGHVYRIKQINA